jgi:hypothetical protein
MNRKLAVAGLVAVLVAALALSVEIGPNLGPKMSGTTETGTSITSTGTTGLDNLGNRIWITEVVFPPNLGWSSDWQDFGSGPRLKSVTQVNSTTTAIVAQSGGILAYSSPSTGRFEIALSKNFTENNYSPGLRPGDLVTFQQVSPAESDALNTPTYGKVETFSVFCNVTLTRNGSVYHGVGVWSYGTAERFSDPTPGITDSVGGWVATPSFILTFANDYGYNNYKARLFWTDTKSAEAVQVNAVDTSQTCTGYSLTVNSSRGTVSVEIPTLKLLLGTPCSPSKGTISESFGAASSNQGNGWAFIGVTK